MAIYRFDVQMKYPCPQNPSGYYYCAATHYAHVTDFITYDLALDTIFDAEWRGHHEDVIPDWCRVTDLDTNTIVRDASWIWSGITRLSGEYPGLCNTVYISFLAGGVEVGYKRVRTPLRCEDIDGEYLTADAVHWFESNYGGMLLTTGLACNVHGTVFDGFRVSPKVSGWQLRHGTKRRALRRYQ